MSKLIKKINIIYEQSMDYKDNEVDMKEKLNINSNNKHTNITFKVIVKFTSLVFILLTSIYLILTINHNSKFIKLKNIPIVITSTKLSEKKNYILI